MVAVGLSTVVAAGVALVGGLPTAMAKEAPAAKTSALEARRVDSVKTPKLGWYSCYGAGECATVKVPMDYDNPSQGTVELAVARVKARDQKHKIGSLFVNPGGPGGSGVDFVLNSPYILSSDLLDRFDIVGFDPRGTNYSDLVTCFPGPRQQSPVLDDLSSVAFPVTKAEQTAEIRGAKALGKACSTTGKPLSASMSTAQVARDMDVLRRAVGDKKLNYFGVSYGSYLGQVYANLFPDRFRALAIDGVLDPVAWAGTKATQNTPVTDRLRSGEGAYKALREILVRCDRAGGSLCSFALGDPVKNFDLVAQRLKKSPLVDEDPFTGETYTFGYADLISNVLGALYLDIEYNLTQLLILTEPPAQLSATSAKRQAAMKRLRANLQKQAERTDESTKGGPGRFGFPYDNSTEAFTAVLCTDSVNPADASSWPSYVAAADKRAKYFGALWTWESAPCASKTWTAKDEDAYRGPFTTRTVAPVLVVGSTWDPATNYAGAVKAASLLPNSRLLSSDNWGHTAYGTSDCATSAIESYLLSVKLPAKGATCTGDVQPFTDPPEDDEELGMNRLVTSVSPSRSTRTR
jgi:pimeloyl-ACP methyl ester carboxylesterase